MCWTSRPSGCIPSNIVGLTGVMHDLVADGNSVILVDHDTQILKEADWIIEMGPEAGAKGGHVIAEGTIPAIEANPGLADRAVPLRQSGNEAAAAAPRRKSCLQAARFICPPPRFTRSNRWRCDIPKGRLTVVTGVSGSGKTTMVLESLVPALER